MARVVLLGTSHVSKESVVEIKQRFDDFNPDIVCVELDRGRLHGLMSKEKTKLSFALVKQIGIKGTLFVLIGGHLQKWIAKKVGSKPGEDMLSAVRLGKKHDKKVALIDQPVNITLARFSKFVKKREFFNGFWDGIRSLFGYRPFDVFDVRKVPTEKQLKQIVSYMEKRFPTIYRVLLAERNIYMVNKLKHIVSENPDSNILVVVGAAHKPGMLELLQK